jgi:hypothetical protein
MITVYVIPGHPRNDNVVRLADSLMGLPNIIRLLKNEGTETVEHESKYCVTNWFMYFYANEWADTGLIQAIPYFLREPGFTSVVLYKKVLVNGSAKIYNAPRIFRAGVRLDCLTPLPHQAVFKHLKYPGCWILEDPRNGDSVR